LKKLLQNKLLLAVIVTCLVLVIAGGCFAALRGNGKGGDAGNATIENSAQNKSDQQAASGASAPAAKPESTAPAPATTPPKTGTATTGSGGTTSGGTATNPSSSGTSTGGGTTTPPEVAGLTNASALTNYTGSNTINSGTVVIENKRFTSRLTVNGGNVTIRNSSFNFGDYYHVLVYGGSVTVEHSEFDGMNTTTTADDLGISGDNLTVRWSVFTRFVNAMRPGSNSLIEHNVISNPNNAYGPAHTDGIEVYGGSNITIRSNTINISGGIGETGCVNIATDFANIDNVLVENNDFTGGTYSFYARLQGAGTSITNIKVRNNRWHTPHIYGTHSVIPTTSITEWTGNTLNGAALPF
jgi:hypothetical protein